MGLEALVFGQSAQGSRVNICYLPDLTHYWVPCFVTETALRTIARRI